MNKICSKEEAVALIPAGAFIATSGFMMAGVAEEIFKALENSFLKTGTPRDLTFMKSAGQGNWADGGYEHFAHEGMIKRVIAGHYGTCVKLGESIAQSKLEAYNLPQGIITCLLKNACKQKPGELTKTGLKTYIDPRLEGGKMNPRTTEDIVELVNFHGEEWLYYKTPKVDIGIIRGTVADENGNITIDQEILPIDMLLVAMAAKACGGKVIAQVKHIAKAGALPSRQVTIPGVFVDAVVVSEDPEVNHRQTVKYFYEPSLSGHYNVPTGSIMPLELTEKKVIARRSAMELVPNAIVNLGIGMPESVAVIASEEGIGESLILTTESGVLGGIPCGGMAFGAGQNAWGSVDMGTQFDFYDGGGFDLTYLGLAQVDRMGNVNVSKFGVKVTGCGGFINISQNTRKIVYCGTFTAGGLKLKVGGGKLEIVQEGRNKKFVNSVEQITYSGEYGAEIGQEVLYVTERAVFKLTAEGLKLIEIAPGLDLQKDILEQMEFTPIVAKDLKLMDASLFEEGSIHLKDIVLAHQ